MVDEEDLYDLWEDLPSRKNLVASLVKSFVVWVLVVVLPSLVIAVIVGGFVYWTNLWVFGKSHEEASIWSGAFATLAFMGSVIYFWKEGNR